MKSYKVNANVNGEECLFWNVFAENKFEAVSKAIEILKSDCERIGAYLIINEDNIFVTDGNNTEEWSFKVA